MVSDAGSRDRVMNLAALCGSVSVTKQILEKGSHEDKKPWGSRTFLHDDIDELQLPLALAAKWGHMEVVAMMLDYGADPSAQGADIWSGVLYNAISSGDIEILGLLLDRGIGIDFKNPKSNDKLDLGVYALKSAVRFPSIFQLLIDREALYPGYSLDSIQSLMAAVVESGNVTLLWTLLDKGVLLDVMPGPDYLKYAARGGLNMLEYLAPYGVLKGPTEDLLLEYGIRKRNSGVLGFFSKSSLIKTYPGLWRQQRQK